MANIFKNTAEVVVNKVLLEFKNQLGLGRLIKHEYDGRFGKTGAKVGRSIEITDQVQLVSGSGNTVTPQSIEEKTRFLRLDQDPNVSWEWDAIEETLEVDQWMEKYGKPAAEKLANKVDVYLMKLAAQAATNFVGTPATAVAAFRTFGDARARIESYSSPPGRDLIMVIDPQTQVEATTLAQGLFNSQKEIARQYEDGNMMRANGWNWHMSQNVYRHTIGTLGGAAPLVDGAQTGASILTDAWTVSVTGLLKKGDKITLGALTDSDGGVRGVNPANGETLSFLQVFTVTADVDSSGTGTATIPIDPPIIAAGAYKNVNHSVANNATVQVYGHASSYAAKVSACNLALHPDAMVWAMAPKYLPKNPDYGAMRQDPKTGVAMRIWRDPTIKDDLITTRIDVLFGALVRHPEWICQVLGA